MPTRIRLTLVATACTLAAGAAWVSLGAQAPSGIRYAITGARIVTGTGTTIDKGTIVMRNGLIEDIGANVTAPADAIAIDGSGLSVYPGLIDMSNTAAVEETTTTAAPAAQAAGRGAGGGRAAGRGAAAPGEETHADAERARRDTLLNPDFDAADHVRLEGDEMQRLASVGITALVAVPPNGLFRGESALIAVTAPPEPDEISGVGADRHGLVVIKADVAENVTFAGRGGGGGGGGNTYPGSVLGTIAFVRQAFSDAAWQHDARAFADRHKDAPLPAFEPVLDALEPALEGKVPVAFEASDEREILRALAMAKEFKLDPIIVGGSEATSVIDDLKAAKARVILSVATGAGGGGRGGRGGGGGDTPIRVLHANQNAPKVAAALDRAGIPFAFSTEGLTNPGDMLRGVGRAVHDGGLSPDVALKALTTNAAKMAGAGDRLGTLEKGRIANVVVTDGDLFEDRTRIRNVFVAGRPVELEVPTTPVPGRGGRGGGR